MVCYGSYVGVLGSDNIGSNSYFSSSNKNNAPKIFRHEKSTRSTYPDRDQNQDGINVCMLSQGARSVWYHTYGPDFYYPADKT